MLVELFSLYLQGLFLSICLVLGICLIWILLRARSKKDKTAIEKQAFLYDMLMIAILLIPIVSFAVMSILLVLKS
ncbi:DUF4059 family protein [Streptococcus uberis]|uniref:Membrane protein n=2 Tax=Streptococcus uberis TaxID=1349 RepID=B9DV70_STRU0|nr:DUF4059 family protein [Streptococcus uberis]KHD39653.1 amino acid ABC transporter [Streptococcus hongkongensis]AUC25438.1 DUF4059 domain-containing protein [Streptococcus uberis]KKF41511.1 membrane protein [Streptococcus uberis Ab71]KKF41564.1 membrane protein [Streptococcus uberis C9359]KKF41641.1 membrane protein [Streptococcus uberis EF20/0145]